MDEELEAALMRAGAQIAGLQSELATLRAERDAAKQLAADRLEQMQADRRQALVWRDQADAARADAERLRILWDREETRAVTSERAKWVTACESIAKDLRNHDMVRLGAAKCLDAGTATKETT